MAYDYSSQNDRLELPNPYRVENVFLFVCAAATLVGGIAALIWARAAIFILAWRWAVTDKSAAMISPKDGLRSGPIAFCVRWSPCMWAAARVAG